MALVLTKKYVIAIGAVACLAIVGLGGNYVVMPSISNIQEAQENISDAEASRDAMEARLSGLQQAEAQYPQVEAINLGLTSQFPESGQTQILLEQLFQGAEANGMSRSQISSITFDPPTIQTPEVAAPVAPPAEGDPAAAEGEVAAAPPADGTTPAQVALPEGFATLGFSMSLSGTEEQIAGYLNYLNGMQRVVTIKETSISTGNGEEGVTLSFSATTYVYRAIAQPGTLKTPEELAEEELVSPEG